MTMGLAIWMAAVYACYKIFRTVKNWRSVLSVFAAAATASTILMLLENRLALGPIARQLIESVSSASLVALAGELLVLFFLRKDWRKYGGSAETETGKPGTFDEFYIKETALMQLKSYQKSKKSPDKK